jgi:5-methylcytosine-specific restriction endonuclease McrA
MPSKVCPSCRSIIRAADYRRHRQAHRQRPTRQANGRSGSTRAWRQLRAQIIARDGGRCRGCGTTERLEIHHRDGDWRNDDPANLVTLCVDCHPRSPGDGGRGAAAGGRGAGRER